MTGLKRYGDFAVDGMESPARKFRRVGFPQTFVSPHRRRVLQELPLNSCVSGSARVPSHGTCHRAENPTSQYRSVSSAVPRPSEIEIKGLEARVAAALRPGCSGTPPHSAVYGGKLAVTLTSPCTTPQMQKLEPRLATSAPTPPPRAAIMPVVSRVLAPVSASVTSDLVRQPSLASFQNDCFESNASVALWQRSSALMRFSTGGGLGVEEPQIRAGWFKSPVENVSMENLNHSHDQERFCVIPLDDVAVWKECHVEFQKGVFSSHAQVNILSGKAGLYGLLQKPAGHRVSLFFPGFQAVLVKLLFRHAGVMCRTMCHQDSMVACLSHAAIDLNPGTLPIGFSIHLQPKAWQDLSEGERVARDYFVNQLAPTIGSSHEGAATAIEGVLHNMAPGSTKTLETVIPAIFDSRPGSRVIAVCLKGRAASASAPQFAELMQAPPGQDILITRVLLKRGDNPHQDIFALAMARVFNYLWQRESVAVSVAGRVEVVQNVLFGVLQSSFRTSVIEVVDGSTAVKSFHDRHSKLMFAMFGDAWWQGDLNDWVPSGPLIASAAAAFTTAYVLDIGDRHQDNMLVTRDGRLFNIDFGYLFGEHPRFVDAQPFAIPVAFRTALVQNGTLWAVFKAACVKAFATLVKHREFVVLQAIELSRALGSHSLMMRALTFGKRLADPSMQVCKLILERRINESRGAYLPESPPTNTLDMFANLGLDIYIQAVGAEVSRNIERGVYGHQAKDILHEKRCVVM